MRPLGRPRKVPLPPEEPEIIAVRREVAREALQELLIRILADVPEVSDEKAASS